MGVTLDKMIEDLNENGEKSFYKYEVMDFGLNFDSADFFCKELVEAVERVQHIAIMGADGYRIDKITGEHIMYRRVVLSNEPEQAKIELNKLITDKGIGKKLSDFAQDNLMCKN